ncbi:hypothetical protein SAMN04515665_104130 [Blastococcus sp. DSM 46786]|uniref:hypothetical protein n=1 Tax=Blastococcus sp. DSM 46786 TaxID=1798227 RepID=UPI0008CA7647|nr:hypothetical protein [Blastococcus sp. DSM 46786]SEK69566.1 hypothetical protein SAMN04515665_104130 [Blastococcus sp. DSM 46786]
MNEHVEVWRQPGGRWRWRYVGVADGGGTVELPSNSSEATCEAAVDAARTAYPGFAVVVDRSSADAATGGADRRARWLGAALVVFLVAARRHGVWTAAVVVVAAVAVTARGLRGARTGGSAA